MEGVHFRRATQPPRGRGAQGAGGQPLRPRGDGGAAAAGPGGARRPAGFSGRRGAAARCGLRRAGPRAAAPCSSAATSPERPASSLTVTVGGEALRGGRCSAPVPARATRSGCRGRWGTRGWGSLLLERPGGSGARRLGDHPRLARAAIDPAAAALRRLGLGAALVGVASACIDLSDGLVAGRRAPRRGERGRPPPRAGALPVSRGARCGASRRADAGAVRRQRRGGLRAALHRPASRELALGRLARRLGLPLTPIGAGVRRGRGVHPSGLRAGLAPRVRPPRLTERVGVARSLAAQLDATRSHDSRA